VFIAEADTTGNITQVSTAETDSLINENIRIIKTRLNQFGITGETIQRIGSNRIKIEIPFTKEKEKVKTLIQARGYLSFHLVKDMEAVRSISDKIDLVLNETEPGLVENQFTALVEYRLASGLNQMPVNIKFKKGVEIMLNKDVIMKIFSDSIKFAWSERAIKTSEEEYLVLYFLDKKPSLDGSAIVEATYDVNPENDNPYTAITLNSEGTILWEKLTGENTGKECAIVFDGKVFSTPRIMSKISGGKINIVGLASIGDAMLLPIILKSGPLSIPMRIVTD